MKEMKQLRKWIDRVRVSPDMNHIIAIHGACAVISKSLLYVDNLFPSMKRLSESYSRR